MKRGSLRKGYKQTFISYYASLQEVEVMCNVKRLIFMIMKAFKK